MKKLLLFILCPMFLFGQAQIGNDIDGKAAGDQSGNSVSLSSDGTILAIGSPLNADNGSNSGHVRVFKNNNGVWEQLDKDINGKATNNFFGWSVDLSSDGSSVAIGAIFNSDNGSNSGSTQVYKLNNDTWEQLGNDLLGEAAGDLSGYSVKFSSDANILAIGAIYNSTRSGHVRIYQFNNNNWEQLGLDINGESTNDQSGNAISLSSDGTIIAIGASSNDGNGFNSGHVRTYQFNNNNWQQLGSDIDSEAAQEDFGTSVSLSSDGTILAVGAPDASNIGNVRVFEYVNNNWQQLGNTIIGEVSGDKAGISTSLSSDGTILAVGSTLNDNNGSNSGHVRIFKYTNNNWQKIGNNIEGEAIDDSSGNPISLSSDGNIIAIGALNNDAKGDKTCHVRVFDLSTVLSTQNFLENDFKIFPNPTSKSLNIQLTNSKLEKVTIYNNLGQKILSKKAEKINIENLKSGIYTIEINTNKGKSSQRFIIK